ncbi:hypothetical protein EJ02DRAFT_476144 [Clathrospora elynae]|uniref:Uncharacterized protein n=1 Tax=Clathrospora elynae TaxID=706981 RepID=A0A6A5SK03_9PLEO|nr:hypothetical protein EJ02DRAFT_476144 [Clathrospora elynae]
MHANHENSHHVEPTPTTLSSKNHSTSKARRHETCILCLHHQRQICLVRFRLHIRSALGKEKKKISDRKGLMRMGEDAVPHPTAPVVADATSAERDVAEEEEENAGDDKEEFGGYDMDEVGDDLDEDEDGEMPDTIRAPTSPFHANTDCQHDLPNMLSHTNMHDKSIDAPYFYGKLKAGYRNGRGGKRSVGFAKGELMRGGKR